MKHTEGEWQVVDDYDEGGTIVVWNADEQAHSAICEFGEIGDMNYAEVLANAKLIAAAPDLLKACIALLKRNEQLYVMVEYPREDMSGETSLKLAKAAIKKATT